MAVMPRRLADGTRVRLRAPSRLLRLQSDAGVVVRKDTFADYYIVRLDKPAFYYHSNGTVEELREIREDADNLQVIPSKR